jgi:K+-transporting ATPase c subunit|tara:strand:- start:67 stop:450 length:384 start_codon:yes stop_codon:yes gene_type:complete
MAGQLDSLLKSVAKDVVATLGSSLDTSITYTKKASGSYNTSTGVYTTTDTSYSINVPIEFIRSEEDLGKETREFKTYITPDLIGDSQPDFDDEITLTYAGSTRVAKIVNISTLQGGQTYLFTIIARF